MSPGVHTESTFESAIETALLERGWIKGSPADYDRGRALDPSHVIAFIQDTQPELWSQLEAQHGAGLRSSLLDTLGKFRRTVGTLELLRRGLRFYGKTVRLAYFAPATSLNLDAAERYRKNRLVVTRQVRFVPGEDHSVDLVLFLNGLPVATIELKNELTNQNIEHAKQQYRRRDANNPLFRFREGALVHFAVDTDRVAMTTRLAGEDTVFLPFDRGHEGGAGNPPHPSGPRTAYLWEDVLARDSFLDILGRFMHLQTEERWENGQRTTKELMLFPRYHQLDVVRRLEAAARTEGPGKSYLVQHSAGSGKTNSIAWLAHRLASLHKNDEKVYHSVVVITDRTVLDRQLQDAIYEIEHKQGVVERIGADGGAKSTQLAAALERGAPIIICTLQTFPFVAEKIGQLPDRNYAVIVDEAHSSQTGGAAQKVKEVLQPSSLEEAVYSEASEGAQESSGEDEILRVMAARGPQPNLSFFAFTATPKGKTLERFGRPDADGRHRPFHLYSMRQAIEEGFILDVLKHYTTYRTFWRLAKKAEDDREVPKRKAAVSLVRFATLHPHNIAQKAEIIIEHFRQKVRHRIGGRAKSMVLTPSRLHAVRYKQAFDRYIAEKGYTDVHPLVAFSGTVVDPDTRQHYTEPAMNLGISETQLPEEFAGDDYNVLIVANKYQTGFDQPLIHTMYVDKRLAGVQAVQALSRLNRTHPGKSDTFVLDFVNEADDIRAAFQPYYEETILAEASDPHQLYELQHRLDAMQVWYASEIESFAKVFYKPRDKQSKSDHALLVKYLGPAVDRFKALTDEKRTEFRDALGAYVGLYAFLSQVISWADPDLEKRYSFGRMLRGFLPTETGGPPVDVGRDVALHYYRLEKTLDDEAIELERGPGTVPGIVAVGTGNPEEDHVKLSELIDLLNERFNTNFTPADQLFFDQVAEEAKADEDVVLQARANPFDTFALAMKSKLADLMIDRLGQNRGIVARFFDEADLRQVVEKELSRRIYEDLRGDAA